MLHDDFGMGATPLAMSWAICSATFYVTWLLIFERRLEPWLRRLTSALIGSPVVWVEAGLFLRIWGVRDPRRARSDGAVGLAGGAFVVVAAFFPVVTLALAGHYCSADPAIEMATYLASTPLVAIFIVRVLLAVPATRSRVPDT